MELSDISLVIIYNQNLVDALEAAVTTYRELRTDLGEEFRRLREAFKKNKIKFTSQQIINSFSQNLKKINQVGLDAKTKIIYSKEVVTKKLEEFDTYQKKLLLSKDDDFNSLSGIDSINRESQNKE